jgi:peptide/nickel transport system permease protein
MFRFLFRRAVLAALLVLVASSASLWLVRLAPGDFVTQTLGANSAPGEAARLRARLGLNQTPSAHYAGWLAGVARLDFGRSYLDERPVGAVVFERAINTGLLALAALVMGTAAGVGFGTLAGARRGSVPARVIGTASLALLSMPPLVISLLLVFIAARTQWLPIGGMRSAAAAPSAADVLWHLIAPSLALALPLAASLERLHARAIGDALRQPFVHAALARGVARQQLVLRSALKPSLRTLASIYGLALAGLFSGSFVVEVVTAWPGLGRLMFDALRVRDVPVVAGCAFAGAVLLAVATLLSDVLLSIVDPRASE